MLSIRGETEQDYEQIGDVTAAAFAASEFGHNGEAKLVEILRAECVDALSLVACIEDEIVGHILFTPVMVKTAADKIQGMGLAPISVLPSNQSTGVGSALIEEGLNRLFDNDCLFVVVLGHPAYYPRFGFVAASDLHVSHGFPGVPQDLFFIRCHPSQTTHSICDGDVYYHPQFGPQHDIK